MSFILAILFFILFIGLFIVLSVLGFIRSLFSFGKHNRPTDNTQSQDFKQPTSKSKIFDKNEGEYVDYEDVDE